MRKLYLVLIGLIILAVVFSGCAGKKSAEPQQSTQGQTLEGNISVPGDRDMVIEDMQTSSDENIDMGSLI